jgi:hypothetical protein
MGKNLTYAEENEVFEKDQAKEKAEAIELTNRLIKYIS